MEVSVFSIYPPLFSVCTLFLYILSSTPTKVSPAPSEEGCLSAQRAELMSFLLCTSRAGLLSIVLTVLMPSIDTLIH